MQQEPILAYKSLVEMQKTVQAIDYIKNLVLEEPSLISCIISSRRSFTNNTEARII